MRRDTSYDAEDHAALFEAMATAYLNACTPADAVARAKAAR